MTTNPKTLTPTENSAKKHQSLRSLRRRSFWSKASMIMIMILPVLNLSCGAGPHRSEDSPLLWQQSRPETQRYAYLEPKDLADMFVFGGSVINTSAFTSAALDTTFDPMNVRLKVEGNKLYVVDVRSSAVIMSFDAFQMGGRYEVDFGSAGNDLTLRTRLDLVGGQFTSKTQRGFWISNKAPEVVRIEQDPDNLVVDLEHTVVQGELARDGRSASMEESAQSGKVLIRLFLTRKNSLPTFSDVRRVADGAQTGFGFFGSRQDDLPVSVDAKPIQRVDLKQGPVTFYLKDVPARYQTMAKRAVLSWNEAFGREVVRVEIAPEKIDAGDPRYHVVRWYDGTDETIQWAGVARMLVEPDTGLVMGGSVYIMGDTLEGIYKGIVQYSSETAARADATLGQATFSGRSGETPIVPFFTNLDQTFEEYMQGYYEETITHEVGHYLGLRHNFAGSTKIDQDGQSASVMDYAPRKERSKVAGPGAYDRAAIQWAYDGVEPRENLPFCTDDDLAQRWDCNHGDFGNPVTYFENGIKNGIRLLSSTPIPVQKNVWIAPLSSAISDAIKITGLIDQLPSSEQSRAYERLQLALREVSLARPDPRLAEKEQQIVEANLEKLRQLLKGRN